MQRLVYYSSCARLVFNFHLQTEASWRVRRISKNRLASGCLPSNEQSTE
ncbi:MAG: hypothetical protein LBG58_10510 [Planctomycetaceae bacterium]|nr:hypothetical protein [Planctomycetaceae bacterium]